MRISIDTRLSVEENAAKYFEKAKRARRKLEGARKALASTQERLHASAKKEDRLHEAHSKRKKEWYERFRWFLSSEGLVCVGGKDATTNETIVKTHAEPGDLVFHTDMAGSPFVVIKAGGKEPSRETREEAAQFCACYGRAWKRGYASIEVFSARPEQLSKHPEQGEFLPKGAFVVRGQIEYYEPVLRIAFGLLEDGRVMAGPPTAIIRHCGEGYEVLQGNEKASDVAKRLASLLGCHPDDTLPLLPPGGVKMGRRISSS